MAVTKHERRLQRKKQRREAPDGDDERVAALEREVYALGAQVAAARGGLAADSASPDSESDSSERARQLKRKLERARRRAHALDTETHMWKQASSAQVDYRAKFHGLQGAQRVHAETLRRIAQTLEGDGNGEARAASLCDLRTVIEALGASSGSEWKLSTGGPPDDTLVFPAEDMPRRASGSPPDDGNCGEYTIRVMRLREEPLKRRRAAAFNDRHWIAPAQDGPHSTELKEPSVASPSDPLELNEHSTMAYDSQSLAAESSSSDEEEFECDTSLLAAPKPAPTGLDSTLHEHPYADDLFLAVSM